MNNSTVRLGYVFFLALVAALGGLLFGYDTAVISGTIDQVAQQFGLDVISQGWYVGCALIGSIAGVSVAGIMSDRLGRKPTMFISAVLFTVSAAGCAISTVFTELVAYRIIGGVGIGKLPGAVGVCELQKMYCLPEARGTGIAQELLQTALEYAKKYYAKCYLETLPNMKAAQKFYEKHGFVRIYEAVGQTGHFACDVLYIKDL